MKKRTEIKLSLNKNSISNLRKSVIHGGSFSAGCSDGCTPFQTALNCTNTNCTSDCGHGSGYTNCPFDDY